MLYSESCERAREITDQALERMAELNVAPNPVNFTVWYTYFCNSNPDLTRAIDVLISNGIEFSKERSEEIYDKYFGVNDEGNAVAQTGAAMQRKVDEVVGFLQQASSDNSEYGDRMEEISGGLVEGKSGEEIAQVVRDLLVETQQVIEKSQGLEQRLQESADEISNLRNHLHSVRQEALTDDLTGLANRKCFDQRLRDEATRAMEEGTTLCLVLADIDHFKKFNDTYGHRVGDSVLKVVARNLSDGVKGQDLPARYGGEEFSLILPETSLENAAHLADQIRSKLTKKELKNTKTNESYGTVTLSLGVAVFRYGEPLSELVERADAALYAAKHAGRNQVITEDKLEQEMSLAG